MLPASRATTAPRNTNKAAAAFVCSTHFAAPRERHSLGATGCAQLPTYVAVALLTGEPDPRVLLAAAGEVAPSVGQAGSAAGAGVKLALPPVDAATVAPAAPYIALGSGVVAGGALSAYLPSALWRYAAPLAPRFLSAVVHIGLKLARDKNRAGLAIRALASTVLDLASRSVRPHPEHPKTSVCQAFSMCRADALPAGELSFPGRPQIRVAAVGAAAAAIAAKILNIW